MKTQINATHIGLQNTAMDIFYTQVFTLAHRNICAPEACIYCVLMLKFDVYNDDCPVRESETD